MRGLRSTRDHQFRVHCGGLHDVDVGRQRAIKLEAELVKAYG